MPGELRLRARFVVDDEALSQLHAQAFAFPAEPDTVEVQPWRSRLERYSLTWVGAFHDDEILVGFVHAIWDGGQHAFLLDTVVDARYRRRGLGSRLVAHLVEEASRAGCHWLHVDYEPHLDPFYRAAGFTPTAAGLIRL